MAFPKLDPIPYTDPLIDAAKRIGERWYRWLDLFVARVLQAVLSLGGVQRSGLSAAIAATTLLTPELIGVFRVTWDARITTAAAVSSSLTVTISWTDGGIACSKSFTAITGNTTATVDSGTVTIHQNPGAVATAIQYATAYASVGAPAMAYQIDVIVEQIG